jgi:hypothetical protein
MRRACIWKVRLPKTYLSHFQRLQPIARMHSSVMGETIVDDLSMHDRVITFDDIANYMSMMVYMWLDTDTLTDRRLSTPPDVQYGRLSDLLRVAEGSELRARDIAIQASRDGYPIDHPIRGDVVRFIDYEVDGVIFGLTSWNGKKLLPWTFDDTTDSLSRCMPRWCTINLHADPFHFLNVVPSPYRVWYDPLVRSLTPTGEDSRIGSDPIIRDRSSEWSDPNDGSNESDESDSDDITSLSDKVRTMSLTPARQKGSGSSTHCQQLRSQVQQRYGTRHSLNRSRRSTIVLHAPLSPDETRFIIGGRFALSQTNESTPLSQCIERCNEVYRWKHNHIIRLEWCGDINAFIIP